jgi:hypothetical protein
MPSTHCDLPEPPFNPNVADGCDSTTVANQTIGRHLTAIGPLTRPKVERHRAAGLTQAKPH